MAASVQIVMIPLAWSHNAHLIDMLKIFQTVCSMVAALAGWICLTV